MKVLVVAGRETFDVPSLGLRFEANNVGSSVDQNAVISEIRDVTSGSEITVLSYGDVHEIDGVTSIKARSFDGMIAMLNYLTDQRKSNVRYDVVISILHTIPISPIELLTGHREHHVFEPVSSNITATGAYETMRKHHVGALSFDVSNRSRLNDAMLHVKRADSSRCVIHLLTSATCSVNVDAIDERIVKGFDGLIVVRAHDHLRTASESSGSLITNGVMMHVLASRMPFTIATLIETMTKGR